MTDRLQQKAEEIVREWLGKDPTNPTSKYIRSSQAFRYVEAGLTAGIAMAASTPEAVLVGKMRTFAEECLRRIAATPSCAGDDLHTEDTYEDILKLCALAKGETQPAGNATKQQMEERWHCDDL